MGPYDAAVSGSAVRYDKNRYVWVDGGKRGEAKGTSYVNADGNFQPGELYLRKGQETGGPADMAVQQDIYWRGRLNIGAALNICEPTLDSSDQVYQTEDGSILIWQDAEDPSRFYVRRSIANDAEGTEETLFYAINLLTQRVEIYDAHQGIEVNCSGARTRELIRELDPDVVGFGEIAAYMQDENLSLSENIRYSNIRGASFILDVLVETAINQNWAVLNNVSAPTLLAAKAFLSVPFGVFNPDEDGVNSRTITYKTQTGNYTIRFSTVERREESTDPNQLSPSLSYPTMVRISVEKDGAPVGVDGFQGCRMLETEIDLVNPAPEAQDELGEVLNYLEENIKGSNIRIVERDYVYGRIEGEKTEILGSDTVASEDWFRLLMTIGQDRW